MTRGWWGEKVRATRHRERGASLFEERVHLYTAQAFLRREGGGEDYWCRLLIDVDYGLGTRAQAPVDPQDTGSAYSSAKEKDHRSATLRAWSLKRGECGRLGGGARGPRQICTTNLRWR